MRFHICLWTLIVSFVVGSGPSAFAAPFVNLDFEQATIPPGAQFATSAANAFPGWTAAVGGVPVETVAYDYDGAGEGLVALYDKPATDLDVPLLQGHYVAILISQYGSQIRSSLSQVGDVPGEAKSIFFTALQSSLSPPQLLVNQQLLALTRWGNAGYGQPVTYAADVSAYASTTVNLSFQSPIPPNGGISPLDDIKFSTLAVPEQCGSLFSLAGIVSKLVFRSRSRDARKRNPKCCATDHASEI